MQIFAIADLHLSFSNPKKSMEFFGPVWKDYQEKIKTNWLKKVKNEDLVLISGDISWAMKLKDALIDLEWIESLPGKKVIIKGNHDYWWPSISKLKKALPPSISAIQNDALDIENISIAGTRLWDTLEFSFEKHINFQPNPREKKDIDEEIQKDLQGKIFQREVERLKISLEKINKNKNVTRIVMTHYPPISNDLNDSIVSKLLEKYKVDICVFGHLHNINQKKMFGEKNNIKYLLTSSDFINFDPINIFD
ncbi:MAG: metallophosphoesterase [Parachlamydiales bacterium]|nr:metallophosphoesterase [Parachlamydiales bacterium]